MVTPKSGKKVKYVGIFLLITVLLIAVYSSIIHSSSEQNDAIIKKVVLHVAKPKEPSKSEYAEQITLIPEVSTTTISVKSFHDEVEIVIITIKGRNLSLELIEDSLKRLGGSVYKVQKVVCKDASET